MAHHSTTKYLRKHESRSVARPMNTSAVPKLGGMLAMPCAPLDDAQVKAGREARHDWVLCRASPVIPIAQRVLSDL